MARYTPLSPGFGVQADDVDLRMPLTDADWRELERAFYDHQVLAIRGQDITPAQFVAFAKRLGPPQPHVIDQFHHPDDPNILILSNV
jgi:taurine dioxygenase